MTAFGLSAKYLAGSCVVCGKGTDTALGVRGVAEWHIAMLQLLGVPKALTAATFAAAVGLPVGTVPDGTLTMAIRVCSACTDASSAFGGKVRPALYVDGGSLPTVEQPRGLL